MRTKVIQDLYCFALSFHFAKKHFHKVHLVTDQMGAFLLDFLDYHDVSLSLEEISHVDPRFWTAGKVKAASEQDDEFLHIDGDVFLLDAGLIEKISRTNWDVMVQMREVGHHYETTYPPIHRDIEKIYPYPQDIYFYNFVYNTGIVGFKDLNFKDDYCDQYFRVLLDLSNRGITFPAQRDPNIVVEQSLLTTMSQNQNKYVKELITLEDMSKYDLFGAAERIGFVHLWGNSKYQEYWQQRVRYRLGKENPKLLKGLEDKLKREFNFFIPEDNGTLADI